MVELNLVEFPQWNVFVAIKGLLQLPSQSTHWLLDSTLGVLFPDRFSAKARCVSV